MWGCDLDLNFHLILELCDDLTSLGTKLLAEATQLGSSHVEANKEGNISLLNSKSMEILGRNSYFLSTL
jgi:hypothetical protein